MTEACGSPTVAKSSPAPAPAVAFWDMDRTLIDTECDGSWKLFLMGRGLAPPEDLELMRRFALDYERGTLDLRAYNAFQLREFAGRTEAEMKALAREHAEALVRPLVFERALELIAELRRAGTRLCLVTATNRVLAEPVAALCGFEHLIATDLEMVDGRYTGRPAGPCRLGAAKLAPMAAFCERWGLTLAEAAYYGDSINDVPVLEAVGRPVAANPSPLLRRVAVERGWEIIDFRKAP